MAADKESFRREIIKIIVDKALIGILLVIVGFFSTNITEKLKTERSFSSELNKIRAQKIGEVWEKVYLYEAEVEAETQALISSAERFAESTPTSTSTPRDYQEVVKEAENEIRKKMEEGKIPSEKAYRELKDLINKNRLWLGERSYSEVSEYISTTSDYSVAVTNKDMGRTNQLKKRREELRATINNTRDRMLKGDE